MSPTAYGQDEVPESGLDPLAEVAFADTVGVALNVVLESLSPSERVAFILHDMFGVEFTAVASVLDSTPVASRKLASRARTKIGARLPDGPPADWEVVDAFLVAAKSRDFARLFDLLGPDVVVSADAVAIAEGTPERLEGREAVAVMFDGGARAACPVFIEGRLGANWFHKGSPRVVFEFTVRGGRVKSIVFRAEPYAIVSVARRRGAEPVPARKAPDVTSPPSPASDIGGPRSATHPEDHPGEHHVHPEATLEVRRRTDHRPAEGPQAGRRRSAPHLGGEENRAGRPRWDSPKIVEGSVMPPPDGGRRWSSRGRPVSSSQPSCDAAGCCRTRSTTRPPQPARVRGRSSRAGTRPPTPRWRRTPRPLRSRNTTRPIDCRIPLSRDNFVNEPAV